MPSIATSSPGSSGASWRPARSPSSGPPSTRAAAPAFAPLGAATRGGHRRCRGRRATGPGRRGVPDRPEVAHRVPLRDRCAARHHDRRERSRRASRARSRTVPFSAAIPYRVLEGALIAAYAVGADTIVIALRGRSTVSERSASYRAIDEVRDGGLARRYRGQVFAGPEEYLFGEETGLLEALDGRAPFPRITPPFRRGVEEIVDASVDEVAARSRRAMTAPRRRPRAWSWPVRPRSRSRRRRW